MMKRDERAVFALRELYEKYGYSRYKMSRFEEYDLYVNNKDFLISDRVITFTDTNGRLLAMKPDVTLSIIKNAPDSPCEIQKVYYNENVYRASDGRGFREIMQTGLECIGDLGGYEIAEAVLLAAKSLALISDRFVLDISHMGLISEAVKSSGLSPAGIESALEFLQSKNKHQLAQLCEEEGVSTADKDKLISLCDCCGNPADVFPVIEKTFTDAEKQKTAELKEICAVLSGCGFSENIRIDFSVGSDLKYYSGVVFKGYIEGIPTGILSGGQYDKLLKKMGRKSKAIGFAVYTDMLERLDKTYSHRVYDTVILHGKDAETSELVKICEKYATDGSVLVCSTLPEVKNWKRLIRYENGAENEIENNG